MFQGLRNTFGKPAETPELKRLHERLSSICRGDMAAVERLIAFEQSRLAGLSEVDAARRAIQRHGRNCAQAIASHAGQLDLK